MFQPVDVALRDGSTVRVREVHSGDVVGLRELLAGMSENSRWLRFLSVGVDLDRAAATAAQTEDGLSLVVTAGSPEGIVAHAMYLKETPARAEVAFEVADAWHGRGIATILLAHLAGAAARDGVSTFVAYVHPSNRRMIGVFRESGFPVEVHASMGELEVEMPAAIGEAARARFEDRGRAAAAAAVAHVLSPASVVLVTVGGTAAGATVMRNLRVAGYGGDLHVRVTPAADDEPLPAAELAVLAVPVDDVLEQARACGAAGVRALVVLSGGFLDGGEEGRARLQELLAICRRHGMRLVGPSSLGVLNTDRTLALNATSAPVAPVHGPVAMASQSGAIGIAAISEATRRGVGLSSFASTGDKADLSGNDFLQYWERDEATRVILLYLESFGNPRRFGTIARRVAAAKPIVAVKSGRRAAAPAPSGATTTRALLGASDVSVDALFEHAGVIRTETVFEQLDVTALLAAQPLPAGPRVGIVSNGRGPAISCADALVAAGLDPGEPVDLGAAAAAADYAAAIAGAAPEVDAIVAVHVPVTDRAGDVAEALHAAARPDTTLLGAFMAVGEGELAELGRGGGVPLYRSPVEAARALGHVARYARWRDRQSDERPAAGGTDSDAAASVIAAALARGEGWLLPEEATALLEAYGIPTADPGRGDADGAVELVAGVLADPDFGPVVVCGLGGRVAELLGDVGVALAPLRRADAAGLVRQLRSFPLLTGYRGAP
ncbi:MAG TPA: GNAT family N-acetyltransferase, partial [Solirubrobacteraceae bacterium]|nr:GNAT family N-acetyltransferase [Solirubrobacteraceae bacterium]